MTIETKRGCGYRKVGACYLCGEYIHVPCDRLPLPLTTCPVCGQGIKVSRGFTEINPFRLWGPHDDQNWKQEPFGLDANGKPDYKGRCKDIFRPCFVCDPKDEPAYIMGVGAKYYTPESFLDEAHRMGISKRIPFIPKGLTLGQTIIYLAHPKAVEVKQPAVLQQAMNILEESETNQPRLLEVEKKEHGLGIFCAFIPRRIEMLVWQHELTDEKRKELEKRNITPIPVPDGDIDHA